MVAAKKDPLCFGKTHSNFLTCSDLKPKSICIRLAVCQCRPGFQAPPVLGKLNWQFSILFRSEGQAADSRKNKKHKQKNTQIRQAGSGARELWLQRFRLVTPPGGVSRGHSVQPCASRKDRLREVQAAEFKLCLRFSQEECCTWMLIQKLHGIITTVSPSQALSLAQSSSVLRYRRRFT